MTSVSIRSRTTARIEADFARQDESTDTGFYTHPRICTHVDAARQNAECYCCHWKATQFAVITSKVCQDISFTTVLVFQTAETDLRPRTTLLLRWTSTMARCSQHIPMRPCSQQSHWSYASGNQHALLSMWESFFLQLDSCQMTARTILRQGKDTGTFPAIRVVVWKNTGCCWSQCWPPEDLCSSWISHYPTEKTWSHVTWHKVVEKKICKLLGAELLRSQLQVWMLLSWTVDGYEWKEL